MANEQNLIPNSQRSPEELREQCRKGGIKSGQVRAFRKTFREDFIEALSDKKKQNELIEAMLKQAKKGNVKAFEVIRDTIGEKPKDEVNTEIKIPVFNIVEKKTDEIEKEFEKYI